MSDKRVTVRITKEQHDWLTIQGDISNTIRECLTKCMTNSKCLTNNKNNVRQDTNIVNKEDKYGHMHPANRKLLGI